jgi:hypothetical protein
VRLDHRVLGEGLVELAGAPQSRVSNHLACLKWCRVAEGIPRFRSSSLNSRKFAEEWTYRYLAAALADATSAGVE